jgi:phosphoenolpyruvate carboxykinase (ATP)
MARHGARCWLVNSGWSGGAYGEGSRMKISLTRDLIAAALSGRLDAARFVPDPFFRVLVPDSCPSVAPEVLAPRNTWRDKDAYDRTARHLAELFRKNFEPFAAAAGEKVCAAGPKS